MRASPFTLRPATAADAAWFGPRLRESDRDEVLALYDNPAAGILEAITGSEICVVAELDGRGVIVLGCAMSAERPLDVGVPWLLATDEVARHPGALTKIGKHYVALFRERWPMLLNYVDERNVVSVRWLQRLGFTVCDAVEFGNNGERFHPFVLGA